MQDNEKKPALRFKGFTDPWEQRKFSELVQIERGGSPRPIDDFITDAPNGLNWVKIGDAPTQGNYITKTAEKIRPEGLSKTREVHPGDLILSNSMSFGKPYIMGIDGCIHDGWLLIRNTYGVFDLTFLCHLLGTPQMLSQYRSLAAGSTVNNLNKELVGNTVVTIPSITEQRVLGDYLEQLDNLITLHQRKYEKLVNIKKSMLDKMFPQNGASVPEIRFKGFTDPWEQRKLGEIAKAVVRNDPASDAPIMMITAGNGFIEQSDRYAFNNAGESLKKYILLECGELAYNHGASKLRPYGSCFALTTVEKARIPFVYHCFSVEKSNPEFLSIELNGANVENQLRKIVSSGARMDGLLNIAYSEYTEVTVQLPKKEEQDWIAKFFKHLDTLITLHQRKLEKLQNIKKSCLEKMFV
ncbi:restriction endonuclease subunit S [Faecalibacterium taiwanense]|uniref:restriction endonuclease subunit S n=1 Tax=Faecalibacterium taiwanense TaxID=3030638 RepID=UPI003AAAB3DB